MPNHPLKPIARRLAPGLAVRWATMSKAIPLHLVSLVALVFLPAIACAEFSFIAQESCIRETETLRIEQIWTEEPESYVAPVGAEAKRMSELVRYTSSDLGDVRNKVSNWTKKCRLAGSTYVLVVNPWDWNARVNGMCGGGDPWIELSVSRNGRPLLRNVVYGGYCDNSWNEHLLVESISISEMLRTVAFTVSDTSSSAKSITVTYGFEEVPAQLREELWRTLKGLPPNKSLNTDAPKDGAPVS